MLIEGEANPDRDVMIRNRMAALAVNVDHVKRAPCGKHLVDDADLELLLYPTMEKCTLECPCVTYDEHGDEVIDRVAVSRCETSKALQRIGVADLGTGACCPYFGL